MTSFILALSTTMAIYKRSLVELGVHLAFSKLKGTEQMQGVVEAFSDAAKRDILLKRLKTITSDDCFNTIESIIKKSIQKQY